MLGDHSTIQLKTSKILHLLPGAAPGYWAESSGIHIGNLPIRCGIGSWGVPRPRAMSVLSNSLASCCRPRRAVRSSSSSGMTPRGGSQRASFGLHARGNEECQADTLGLAPVGRPKSLVDMLLSPATPEPPDQATRDIVRCQS